MNSDGTPLDDFDVWIAAAREPLPCCRDPLGVEEETKTKVLHSHDMYRNVFIANTTPTPTLGAVHKFRHA